MKHKLQHFRTLLLVALMAIVGSNSAWADTETITFTATSGSGTNVKWETAKNDGSTDPAYTSNELRLYPKNTLTISSTTKKISKIVFSYGARVNKKKVMPTGVTASIGTITDFVSEQNSDQLNQTATWTAPNETTNSLVLTVNGSAGNYAFTSMEVTFVEDGDTRNTASWDASPETAEVEIEKSATITITTNFDKTLSVESEDEDIVKAEFTSSNVITITGVAAGDTKLTITGTGSSTYKDISKTIDVSVKAAATPIEAGTVTFDATVDKGSSSSATTTYKIEKGAVTFSADKGSNNNAGIGGNGSYYSIYKNAVATFTAVSGFHITKIVFTNSGSSNKVETAFNEQEGWDKTSRTWTGEATSVSFTAGGEQARFTKVEVTVEEGAPKKAADFSFPQDEYSIVVGNTFTAPTLSTADGFDGTVAYASDNTSVAEVNASTGAVTVKAVGDAVISVTSEATSNFTAGSASYTLHVVNKFSPELTLETEAITAYLGTSAEVVVTTATGYTGTITAESDNDDVALADYENGKVVIVYGSAAGTATITVTAVAAGDYEEQTKTITINLVEAPSITLDTKALTFDYADNTDDMGSYANTEKLTSWKGKFDGDATATTFDGFTFSNVGDYSSGIQLKKTDGVITFPIIKSPYGFTVTYELYTGKTQNPVVIIDDAEATDTDAKTATLKIKGGSAATYLQSITLTPKAAPVSNVDVTIGETGYATLYYGDLNLVVPEGVEAITYCVTDNKLEESYMYSKDEVIPAKTAVVLKGEKGNYTFAVTSDDGEKDSGNMLKGADEDGLTTGGTFYYALSLNAAGEASSVGFYWVEDGGKAFSCPAHKAYLALSDKFAEGGAVRSFLLNEVQTGIAAALSGSPAEGRVYDLQGRRVGQPTRGLYIVNGKKVFVK